MEEAGGAAAAAADGESGQAVPRPIPVTPVPSKQTNVGT